MHAKTALPVLLVLATGGSEALAADLVPLEWSADGRFAKELAVPATQFVEVCGKLPAGAQVKWSFESGGPVDFNVHYHEGKKVIFPARKSQVAKADGTLKAKLDQDYCWMWSNKRPSDTSLKLVFTRVN